MTQQADILPPRAGETDDERRLREAINRTCGQALSALDAAIRLRTAPSEVQRMRHIARTNLQQFAITAQHAMALNSQEGS